MSIEALVIPSIEEDFPEQFKDKVNIKGFLSAFESEINELADVFVSLVNIGSLEKYDANGNLKDVYAVGKNLDRIGEIIGLTRANASSIYGKTEYYTDDDEYRKALLFYALWKGSDGTYKSLYEIFHKVYDKEIDLYEMEGFNNTLFISLDNEESTNDYSYVPHLVPMGIALKYATRKTATFGFTANTSVRAIDYINLANQIDVQLVEEE